MPDLTPRIGIKKPLGNENVSRAAFNENWDIIDEKVATLGSDGKVPLSQLSASNAFTNVAGKTGGTLNTVVADGPTDTLTIEGQGLIQVTADPATDTIVVNTTAEVNQNAFANVNVNGALLTADFKSDQLNVLPGTGISVVADSPNNAMTISLATPVWQDLTLQNGGINGNTVPPQYALFGNEVIFRGSLTIGTYGVQSFVLPTGFRPPNTVNSSAVNTASGRNGGVRAYVPTSGAVTFFGTINSGDIIDLTSMSFRLN